MSEVTAIHLREYGRMPEITVKVPGISRFLGPFADYSRGCSLCAADSRNLFFCISKRNDSQVKLFNCLSSEKKHFMLSSLKFRKEDRWANYIKGVLAELVSARYSLPGLSITIGGDILSGSSNIVCCALVVATCLAMQEELKIKLEYSSLVRMIIAASTAFSGEPCCSSVVRAMLCSEENRFVYFDNNRGELKIIDNPFTGDNALLYIESGVHISVMKEEVKRKHDEMKNLMEMRYPDISIPLLAGMNEMQLKERTFNMIEDDRRVVRYLVEEYKTARLADFSDVSLGRAMGRNGKALMNILELSFPELDWIIKRANETPLCLGSTIVANGGSGVAGAVMSRSSVDSFAAKLEDYEHIFGFKVGISEFRPGRGAVVFRNTDENIIDK